MIEYVKSYRKKCLFPVLLFSAMLTSAQIDFQQILVVVYTFTTDISSFWFFLLEFYFLVVVHCLIYIYFWLFLVVNLPLSELRSSSRADCLIAGINCFDTGVELDCVLACFGGKVDEMRVFLFVGKISSAFGCD